MINLNVRKLDFYRFCITNACYKSRMWFTLTEFHGLGENRDCNDVASDPGVAFK